MVPGPGAWATLAAASVILTVVALGAVDVQRGLRAHLLLATARPAPAIDGYRPNDQATSDRDHEFCPDWKRRDV